MKKLINSLYLLIFLLPVLPSCTKNFDEINTNPAAITTVGKTEFGYMFSRAQSAACINQGYYQTVQNLYADLYAQYFALNTTSFQTDRYVINQGWVPRLGIVAYTFTVPQLKSIIDNSEENSGKSALANIMWVYTFHHLTDFFGPVAYFNAGEPVASIPYDSQEAIYMDFFEKLSKAVKDLKSLSQSSVFGTSDIIYGGDVQQWIRFANTLQLRLALRVSKAAPTKAKQVAEEAVASGVMTDIAHTAWILKTLNGADGNGLARIAGFNEFSMSSTMASYLKGYNDPRMAAYFQPAVNGGGYKGLRNGTTAAGLGNAANNRMNLSNIGSYWVAWNGSSWIAGLEKKQPVLYAAEAYFLRAEGAINGWNMGGTAKDFYEKGIETSMKQWGIDNGSISNYVQSDALPSAPGDAAGSPPVSNTPVKWATSESLQRAQIGTQKWLAVYPDGFEGWAEYRRSGYPVMYPVLQSDNADLPAGTFIKRLPYPSTEATTNKGELEKGIQLLGGQDKVSTSLWWAK